jgi:hypothetical protein
MEPADADAAWAQVLARWDDEAAHRAFLDGARDLDGLAVVGRRYKAALDAAPGDQVALRWRDEVVRRATVIAFAALPRTRPPSASWRGARAALLAAFSAAAVAAIGWVALRFASIGGALR